MVKRNLKEDAFSIAFFMDAVPYSLTESVVGIWLVNLLTRQRDLMSIVRKRVRVRLLGLVHGPHRQRVGEPVFPLP